MVQQYIYTSVYTVPTVTLWFYVDNTLGLPPDADGNGNCAFFDATNYAANFGGNYAELCSKCGIMLELLRLHSGASYGSATVISPVCDRNGRALSIVGVPSCLEHPVSCVVTCLTPC